MVLPWDTVEVDGGRRTMWGHSCSYVDDEKCYIIGGVDQAGRTSNQISLLYIGKFLLCSYSFSSFTFIKSVFSVFS